MPLRAARHTPVRSCRMELDNKRRRGGYDGDAKQSSGAASLKKGRERERWFLWCCCVVMEVKGEEGRGAKSCGVHRRNRRKTTESALSYIQ